MAMTDDQTLFTYFHSFQIERRLIELMDTSDEHRFIIDAFSYRQKWFLPVEYSLECYSARNIH